VIDIQGDIPVGLLKVAKNEFVDLQDEIFKIQKVLISSFPGVS
jgi:hypothetical protein